MLSIIQGNTGENPISLELKYSKTKSTAAFQETVTHPSEINYVNTLTQESKETPCIVVICALQEELRAAREAFGITPPPKEKPKRLNELSYFEHEIKEYRIIFLSQSDTGMALASSLTTRAILAFKPILVAMTGICAGRKGMVHLGDIIIAKQIFDYTAGKYQANGFKPRPHPVPLNPELASAVNMSGYSDRTYWAEVSQRRRFNANTDINVHFKDLASGGSVIGQDGVIAEIAKIQDNLRGIDMEAFGFALAAHELKVPWLLIKGVQDFGDEEKTEKEEIFRDFAMYASASLLHYLIFDCGITNQPQE